MRKNKLILGLLAISITINIVVVIFGSDNQKSPSYDSRSTDFKQLTNSTANSTLFEQNLDLGEVSIEEQSNTQLHALREKIAILAKQNKSLQEQIEETDEQQANISNALTNVVDLIDSQFLTPTSTLSENQPSNFNLDFNSITPDVVKQCMKLTSEATVTIGQQNQQSRQQQLLDEEIDAVWGGEVETRIQDVISNNSLQNSQMVSLNCRTTICQITIQHNSETAKKLFEAPFFSTFQQSVSHYEESIDADTNQSIGIFYLTRSKVN